MLKALILAAVLVGVISAATDAEWSVFKAEHGKVYRQEEDYFRRMIFEENLQTIRSHNVLFAKGLKSFYLGVNEFTDMTNVEFVKMMNGYRSNGIRRPTNQVVESVNASLPSEVNWVKKGYVTPVKNQGQCGSCWSFSTTGSIEGAHFKATGKLVSLSEKNLMDCSTKFGNHACEGGLMDNAFRYVIANKGIDTEASYPYQPEDSPRCKYNPDNKGATISSYHDVVSGSEMHLQEDLANNGPVSVAIDASHQSFQLYRGGVYDEPNCSSTQLDHGVLAVGYGSENDKDYWLVKNSWGKTWGEEGYIKMSRNRNNQCGIATKASYPIV